MFDPEPRSVSPAVEGAFGFAEINVVSFADLFGGKIIAALDRQQPRDLFDVRELLTHEGIDEDLRRAVIVYLLSHNRPMYEVLAPSLKDISGEFERGFVGMTDQPLQLDDLVEARASLIAAVTGEMPEERREFLLSFERGSPDWSLLGLIGVENLPAVRWRQHNLGKLKPSERGVLVRRLEEVLQL